MRFVDMESGEILREGRYPAPVRGTRRRAINPYYASAGVGALGSVVGNYGRDLVNYGAGKLWNYTKASASDWWNKPSKKSSKSSRGLRGATKNKKYKEVDTFTYRRGNGQKQERRIATLKKRGVRKAKISKGLRKAIKNVVAGDKEYKSRMFMLKNTSSTGGSLPTFDQMEVADLTARLDRSDMYTPTGLSYIDTAQADIDRAIFKGGFTFFPFNMIKRASDVAGIARDPAKLSGIYYQGDSFNPKYCVVDYGYKEGQNFFSNRAYGTCEIVFGLVKDQDKLQNYMQVNNITMEEAINLVLGHPGKNDESVNGSDWPFRTIGTNDGSNDIAQAKAVDKRKLRGMIRILKRDTFTHKPINEVKADSGDGVDHVTSNEAGYLFGSGSFKFPSWSLKKQDRLAFIKDEDGTTESEPVLTFDPEIMAYKKNMPFIHLRGCAKPDTADPRTSTTTSNYSYGMPIALRFKIGIQDDE